MKQDEEYVKANNKELAIFDALRDSLDNEEQEHLLLDLDAAYNHTVAIFLEYSYIQGLKDSFTMRQEFRRISNIYIEDEAETDEFRFQNFFQDYDRNNNFGDALCYNM